MDIYSSTEIKHLAILHSVKSKSNLEKWHYIFEMILPRLQAALSNLPFDVDDRKQFMDGLDSEMVCHHFICMTILMLNFAG